MDTSFPIGCARCCEPDPHPRRRARGGTCESARPRRLATGPRQTGSRPRSKPPDGRSSIAAPISRSRPPSRLTLPEDGRIRFGSSSSVPSRLADPATGLATVVLVVTDDRFAAPTSDRRPRRDRACRDIRRDRGGWPGGRGMPALDEMEARAAGRRPPARDRDRATRASGSGPAAAVNIGIRRASGPVVVVLDPAVELSGDIVTPLVRALDDRAVAVAGGWGSVTRDRRHFEDAPPGDVDVIDGAAHGVPTRRCRRTRAAGRAVADGVLHGDLLEPDASRRRRRRSTSASGRAADVPAISRGAPNRWRAPQTIAPGRAT